MKAYYLPGILCCGVSIIVNFVAFIILCKKNTNLRTNQFMKLSICLSVSDTFLPIVFILSLTNINFNENAVQREYLSIVLVNILGSFFLFSTINTFQLCVSVLNATFLTTKSVLSVLSSTKASVSAIMACLGTTGFRIYYDISYNFMPPQGKPYGASFWFRLTVDLPGLTLLAAIVVIFMTTTLRIKKRSLAISKMANTSTEKERLKKRNEASKRNMKTLVVIFCLTFFGYAPRQICLVLLEVSDVNKTEQLIFILKFVNFFMLLKPIFDPFVFMFRWQEVRKEIRKVFCPCHQNE